MIAEATNKFPSQEFLHIAKQVSPPLEDND